ncbi:MAG: DUF169 domain-containing protein [Megasphaera sp.]|jgi:uncharacterized protein (DUF169 family)|nr:DUF169 domain-containing protein [Megasphaera sp.]
MDSEIAKRLKLKYGPIAVIFADRKPEQALEFVSTNWACATAMLTAAANGKTAVFSRQSCPCAGGLIGLGLDDQFSEGFEYFLSTGNPKLPPVAGIPEPEGFKKTPALAKEWIQSMPVCKISEPYVIFKPLAAVTEHDRSPKIVVCYANPDQLTALIVLANYGRPGYDNVIAPFASGCMSACLFAYAEAAKEQPRAVIGMTDVSARPHIDANLLSFSMPYQLFCEMEENVPGSFLDRYEWQQLAKRI